MKRWYLLPILGGGAALAGALLVPNLTGCRKHVGGAAAISTVNTATRSSLLLPEEEWDRNEPLDYSTLEDHPASVASVTSS